MTYAFCYHFQLDDPFTIIEAETSSFHLFLGAWSRFSLLSSRFALAPDLELSVLDLRLDFFLESLPFRYFRARPRAWSRLSLANFNLAG